MKRIKMYVVASEPDPLGALRVGDSRLVSGIRGEVLRNNDVIYYSKQA